MEYLKTTFLLDYLQGRKLFELTALRLFYVLDKKNWRN